MAYAQANASNRINPVPVSVITHTAVPQMAYDEVALCTDPNCPVCRAQRRDKRRKHYKRSHRHHHHHRHRTNFWNSLLPRVESPLSTVSVHSIELNDRRVYDTERAIVPVNQTDRQIVTRTQPIRREELVEDAWTRDAPADDEVVCCRAYNGCRCPCWCFLIFILLVVIMIIVLIVLLATLL